MSAIAIIPARYTSTRFPGKPLVEIAGKSMIQRVYEQTLKFKSLQAIVIATDDERIYNHAQKFADLVYMTSPNHQSGTDRCAEALKKYEEQMQRKTDIVLNIQGDEPFIHPEQISLLYHCFDKPNTPIATLIKKIDSLDQLFNHNVVKVVANKQGKALYFSRRAIPYIRNQPKSQWLEHQTYYKHLGMYGYSSETLRQITQLSVSPLEKSESLEQLRWLENGFSIATAITERESHSIDTPEDLENLGI